MTRRSGSGGGSDRSGSGGGSDRSGDAGRRSPLLRWALLAYPRERRERDGEVLLDCAAELVAADASRLGEAAGLVRGGVAQRLASVRSDALDAPWAAVGERLAVPLAGANLALWLVGVSRFWDSRPLGWWWTLVLAGAVLALLGAVTRRRGLALLGWGLTVALVAESLLAQELTRQASRFGGVSLGPLNVDLPATLGPLLLLGLACATQLRGPARARDLAWAAPALALAALPRPVGPDGPLGEFPAATLLVVGLLLSPVIAGLLARRDPVRLTIAAALAAVAAPGAVWLLIGALFSADLLLYPGPVGALAVLAGLGALSARAVLALVRRAGREAARS